MAKHLLQADPNAGTDWKGRYVCTRCHVVGEPGDAKHVASPAELLDAALDGPDARELAAGDGVAT